MIRNLFKDKKKRFNVFNADVSSYTHAIIILFAMPPLSHHIDKLLLVSVAVNVSGEKQF